MLVQKKPKLILDYNSIFDSQHVLYVTTPQQYSSELNALNPELNNICYLLALLGAHNFLHVGRIRVKSEPLAW